MELDFSTTLASILLARETLLFPIRVKAGSLILSLVFCGLGHLFAYMAPDASAGAQLSPVATLLRAV
jgi:hypothetical protein